MLNLFISNAYAAPAISAPGADASSFILLIGFVVIFYFFLIRPQNKRAKAHRELITNLAKGDEVITNGGILGRIVNVLEDFIIVEIAEGIKVTLQKNYIASVIPKGTLKSV
ncbi:MAG: Sec translocon accessory complex subunit YajC [Legionellaceae bacterium]